MSGKVRRMTHRDLTDAHITAALDRIGPLERSGGHRPDGSHEDRPAQRLDEVRLAPELAGGGQLRARVVHHTLHLGHAELGGRAEVNGHVGRRTARGQTGDGQGGDDGHGCESANTLHGQDSLTATATDGADPRTDHAGTLAGTSPSTSLRSWAHHSSRAWSRSGSPPTRRVAGRGTLTWSLACL